MAWGLGTLLARTLLCYLRKPEGVYNFLMNYGQKFLEVFIVLKKIFGKLSLSLVYLGFGGVFFMEENY